MGVVNWLVGSSYKCMYACAESLCYLFSKYKLFKCKFSKHAVIQTTVIMSEALYKALIIYIYLATYIVYTSLPMCVILLS